MGTPQIAKLAAVKKSQEWSSISASGFDTIFSEMKEATLQFYKERMLRVLVHIQQNLDEPLELSALAKLASLSPFHFHHVFTGMLGESLASHVRRLRLE